MSPETAHELGYVFKYLKIFGNRVNDLPKYENKEFCLLINILTEESVNVLKQFGIIYNLETNGAIFSIIYYNDEDRKKFMIWWKLTN